MRDYDEVTNTVLRRRDERIAVHKRRIAIMRNSTVAALSLCLVAAVGLRVWNRKPAADIMPADNVIVSVDTTVNTVDQTTTAVTGKPDGGRKTSAAVSGRTAGAVTTVTYSDTKAAAVRTSSAAGANVKTGMTTAVRTTSARKSDTAVTTSVSGGGNSYTESKVDYPNKLAHRVLRYKPEPNGKPYIDFPRRQLSAKEKQLFGSMDSGELPTDINMDGRFDIRDCMDIIGYEYGYETSPEVAENIMKHYDINGDGIIYEPEGDYLLKYYIVNQLTYEDLLPGTYADIEKVMGEGEYVEKLSPDVIYDDVMPLDHNNPDRYKGKNAELTQEQYMAGRKLSEILINKLKSDANELKAFYTVFLRCARNQVLDLDVNKDNIIDIKDWYFQYTCYLTYSFCEYLDDELVEESALTLGQIMQNCKRNYSAWEKLTGANDVADYAAWYCFETVDVNDKSIFTEKYYDTICKTYRNRYICSLLSQKYSEVFKSVSEFTFNSYPFFKAVEYGHAVVADSNGDGVLDIYDSMNADIYYRNVHALCASDERIVLPENVEKFFRENCDLNNNGVNGDMHDLIIYELAVYEFADDPVTIDDQRNNHYTELYNAYVEQLRGA